MAIPARAIALLLAVLLAPVALAACGDEDEKARTETLAEPTEGVTAATEEVTDAFGDRDVEAARIALEGIINRDIKDPAYRAGGFRSDPAISPDLIAQINQLEDEAKKGGGPGIGFDPFICAQNTPTGVTFNEAGAAADRITFIGVFEFGGSTEKVTYILSKDPDREWELVSTECLDAAVPRGE